MTVAITDEERRDFDRNLEIAKRREDANPAAVWVPQPGFQTDFMQCPLFELLGHGTRGGGKTDVILMDYAQFVGRGFGAHWRGKIFRKTYPQLADIIAKSLRWFPRIFPKARFNWSSMEWKFEDGEVLSFRHASRPEHIQDHLGHETPFLGYEELTNWASDEIYKAMFSCCRSSKKGIPLRVRANTNSYGPGSGWVKQRFNLSNGRWRTTQIQMAPRDENKRKLKSRAALHSHLRENLALLEADPDYETTIATSANNDAMLKSWLDGDWDIVAGGMFADVWGPDNILPRIRIPKDLPIERSFDWGSSKPFSVGWWIVSDGRDFQTESGEWRSTVRGDRIRVKEWYGSTGKPNEGLRMLAVDVAAGIVARELAWGWRRMVPTPTGTKEASTVVPGPADASIFAVENGVSIAVDMMRPVRLNGRIYAGVTWHPSDKRAGSRIMGWEMVRKMMAAAKPKPGYPRENPGLFVVAEDCEDWVRTVPSLPRDPDHPDDVDTDAEDHCGDETRYVVRGATNRSREVADRVAGTY